MTGWLGHGSMVLLGLLYASMHKSIFSRLKGQIKYFPSNIPRGHFNPKLYSEDLAQLEKKFTKITAFVVLERSSSRTKSAELSYGLKMIPGNIRGVLWYIHILTPNCLGSYPKPKLFRFCLKTPKNWMDIKSLRRLKICM